MFKRLFHRHDWYVIGTRYSDPVERQFVTNDSAETTLVGTYRSMYSFEICLCCQRFRISGPRSFGVIEGQLPINHSMEYGPLIDGVLSRYIKEPIRASGITTKGAIPRSLGPPTPSLAGGK